MKKKPVKFSILTACFNKGQYISECLNSVVKQTYAEWEMIVINDASTDNSAEELNKVIDPRIKVIHNQEQMFCSSVYALALKHATGDLVGILDGDDALERKAMTMLVKRYNNYSEIDHIYTQFHWCNKRLQAPRSGFSSMPRDGKSLADMTLGGKHCYSHWRTFRRKLADKGEIFPEGLKVSVDKCMGFNLEELGKGGFLNRRLYFYRYYKNNMSKTLAEAQKITTINLAKQKRKYRKKNKIKVYPIIKIF